MFLRQFFIPSTPVGYRPGSLLTQIGARDVPQLKHDLSNATAAISLEFGRIEVCERIRRDFLQHTTLAVFGMGKADSTASATAHHSGGLRRTGVQFKGDSILSSRLNNPEVVQTLLPLDFTRLEVTGSPAAFRVEIETYGAAEVVMQLPKVRRYIPLGPDQSACLLRAFDAIDSALSIPGPTIQK